MITTWTCERPNGRTSKELAIQMEVEGDESGARILIIPALFDEANSLRRQSAMIMRGLRERNIPSVLPDFPGMNESIAPFSEQTLSQWQADAEQAAKHFSVTHILAIRGGALIAPRSFTGWLYAPPTGARLMRNMLRAQVLALRESGEQVTTPELGERGAAEGIGLAGWSFGAQLFGELQSAKADTNSNYAIIEQSEIGGAGLWLRAEAGEDKQQAVAIADLLATRIAAGEGAA